MPARGDGGLAAAGGEAVTYRAYPNVETLLRALEIESTEGIEDGLVVHYPAEETGALRRERWLIEQRRLDTVPPYLTFTLTVHVELLTVGKAVRLQATLLTLDPTPLLFTDPQRRILQGEDAALLLEAMSQGRVAPEHRQAAESQRLAWLILARYRKARAEEPYHS